MPGAIRDPRRSSWPRWPRAQRPRAATGAGLSPVSENRSWSMPRSPIRYSAITASPIPATRIPRKWPARLERSLVDSRRSTSPQPRRSAPAPCSPSCSAARTQRSSARLRAGSSPRARRSQPRPWRGQAQARRAPVGAKSPRPGPPGAQRRRATSAVPIHHDARVPRRPRRLERGSSVPPPVDQRSDRWDQVWISHAENRSGRRRRSRCPKARRLNCCGGRDGERGRRRRHRRDPRLL